jgi:hypothetical protein
MGLNGIFDRRGRPTCDECAHVKRDADGYAWEPREQKYGMMLQSVGTGKVERRPGLLGRRKGRSG